MILISNELTRRVGQSFVHGGTKESSIIRARIYFPEKLYWIDEKGQYQDFTKSERHLYLFLENADAIDCPA